MRDLIHVRESFIKRQLAEEEYSEKSGEGRMGLMMMMAALGNSV